MPGEKNRLARVLVPLIVIALAAGVVVSIGLKTRKQPPAPTAAPQTKSAPQSQSAPEAQGEAAPAPPAAHVAESSEEPAPSSAAQSEDQSVIADEEPAASMSPPSEQTLAASAVDLGPLRARIAKTPDGGFDALGSVDESSDFFMRLEFTPAGAGVEAITLSRYYTDIERTEHYAVQRRTSFTSATGPTVSVVSLAARAVLIDGVIVDLYSTTTDGSIWRQTAPGAFEAIIENESDEAVARITKRFVLEPRSYNIHIEQRFENLTSSPISIEWVQYGPVDLPLGAAGYGGDPRRVRFGYLLGKARDPSQQLVQTERRIHRRRSIINKPLDKFGRIWPTPEAEQNGWSLVWAAMTNRYFAFVVHPVVPVKAAAIGRPFDKVFHLAAGRVDRVIVGARTSNVVDDRVIVMQMRSPKLAVAPDASVDLSFSAYTGPKWRRTLGQDPVYTSLSMNKLLVFNFGGPCAFFTFQWLSHGMLRFLGFFHNVLFHDWALAIMFLVVCVRGLLHPVTKRSQISLQRFSKQMQSLAPKQKKLQEKFKDDPKRQKEEIAKLMREEGINFAGALGCLPMFMQSPVWIALYAMLFFAFDLRHQPGFFGVFQAVSGGHWRFMQDLSAPDSFISFGRTVFALPLFGSITSLNLLPILLGGVFYVHQKYMSPPPSATPSPEQQKQQKYMRLITVVLFPVMMYNAPSGLALYFITNSTLAIFESRHIRAHIERLDLERKNAPPPARKPVRNLRQASSRLRQPSPLQPKHKKRKK